MCVDGLVGAQYPPEQIRGFIVIDGIFQLYVVHHGKINGIILGIQDIQTGEGLLHFGQQEKLE